MEYFSCSDTCLQGYTLILPAVSVGNVGQLTCDLIISTLKLKKVGQFLSAFILPVVGSDPFSKGGNSLTLSLEVFADHDRKLAVVQQRSPLVTGKQNEYTKHMIEWIRKEKFDQVIVLTSCHAYERKDDEIMGTPLRYIVSPEDLETRKEFEGLTQLKEMGKRKAESGEEEFQYFLPGGGMAKNFLEETLSQKSNFKFTVMIIFCSEGDNIPEAIAMANVLNEWKKFIPSETTTDSAARVQWKSPISWKYLFGNRQPLSIF